MPSRNTNFEDVAVQHRLITAREVVAEHMPRLPGDHRPQLMAALTEAETRDDIARALIKHAGFYSRQVRDEALFDLCETLFAPDGADLRSLA